LNPDLIRWRPFFGWVICWIRAGFLVASVVDGSLNIFDNREPMRREKLMKSSGLSTRLADSGTVDALAQEFKTTPNEGRFFRLIYVAPLGWVDPTQWKDWRCVVPFFRMPGTLEWTKKCSMKFKNAKGVGNSNCPPNSRCFRPARRTENAGLSGPPGV